MEVLYRDISSFKIQKLILNSLDLGLYQAIVQIDGQEFVVCKDEAKALSSRSLIKLRESFDHLDIEEIVLRQESAYDEMIGLGMRLSSNRLEVPVAKNLYEQPKRDML